MKRFFISFSVCLFCLLSACSGDSPASETISTYSFGEDTIPALEQVMTEQSGGRLTAVLSPESTAGDDAGTDDGNAERTDSAGNEADATSPYIAYDYQQFTEYQTGPVVRSYVDLLTGEAIALQPEEKPDDSVYTQPAGSILLTRQAVMDGATSANSEGENTGDGEATSYASLPHDPELLFRVRIDWTPTSCLVTLDHVAGQDFGNSLLTAGSALSFSTAKDLLNTVSPEEIGLPGSSMSEYSLKPGPGFVEVDHTACLTIYVYQRNAAGTNSLVETYFISSDGSTLYRQTGTEPNQVEKITLSGGHTSQAASSDREPTE